MSHRQPPWPPPAYRVDLPHLFEHHTSGVAGELFRRVWRSSLDEPGFALIRFAGMVDSHTLRRFIVQLVAAFPERFVPEWFGRFDQQVSSHFHRDGAPARSLLLLGYEPSPVRSRVFVADAHRAAVDSGLGIREFLAAHNPMTPAGDAVLWPYTTELAVPLGESFVVAINNSLKPHEPGNPLGVLHKAEIVTPDPTARRVINSVGLMSECDPSATPKDPAAIEHFLTRTDLD